MRPELAAGGARAENARAVFRGPSTLRSAVNRFAPIRRHASQGNPGGIFPRTWRSPGQRPDVGRPRGQFHAGRTFPRAEPWLPSDHARSRGSARGNGVDLLSEHSLLRIVGLSLTSVIPSEVE